MKRFLTAATLIAGLGAGSAQAASIGLADYSFTPDGSSSSPFQNTDIKTANGGSDILAATVSGTTDVYLVTTFTFGAASNAHLQAQFFVLETGAPRLGVEVNDDGLVQIIGTNPQPSVDLAQDMAGQTVTLLAKLSYDATNSVTYSQSNASNDTLMNVWVNPTASSVEGSGLTAGDMSTVWNSSNFRWFRQVVQNQSTPGTAGDSSITNTVILTGADATFENALLAAGVPEPGSLALLGLGGLLVARRRRG